MFREGLNLTTKENSEKKESKKVGKELVKDTLRRLVFHNKKAKIGDMRVVKNPQAKEDSDFEGDLLIRINHDGEEQTFPINVADKKLLTDDFDWVDLSEKELAAILAEVEETAIESSGEQPEDELVVDDDNVVKGIIQRCIAIRNKNTAEPMDINNFDFEVKDDEGGDNFVLRAQDSQGKEAEFVVSGFFGSIDVGSGRFVKVSDKEFASLNRITDEKA